MVSGMDKRLRFMTDLIAPLKVAPGSEVRLSRDHDPGYTGGVARPQAAALLADGVEHADRRRGPQAGLQTARRRGGRIGDDYPLVSDRRLLLR